RVRLQRRGEDCAGPRSARHDAASDGRRSSAVDVAVPGARFPLDRCAWQRDPGYSGMIDSLFYFLFFLFGLPYLVGWILAIFAEIAIYLIEWSFWLKMRRSGRVLRLRNLTCQIAI